MVTTGFKETDPGVGLTSGELGHHITDDETGSHVMSLIVFLVVTHYLHSIPAGLFFEHIKSGPIKPSVSPVSSSFQVLFTDLQINYSGNHVIHSLFSNRALYYTGKKTFTDPFGCPIVDYVDLLCENKKRGF